MGSLIAAHTMFTLALVVIIVRARLAGLESVLNEASADLYATPLGTFCQITLPLIAPAVLAGFLLSFTFSFDDFIIAFFVAGSETTLPIYIFSSIRCGITPEVNAIGTMVIGASLIMLVQVKVADMDASWAINVRAHFVAAQAVIAPMRANGGGSVIITSSGSGVQYDREMIAYATTKHAVLAMTRQMAATGWMTTLTPKSRCGVLAP